MLLALDIFFTALHSLVILFTLTGWFFKKTRKLHLIHCGIIVLSWVGLGFFYGFGYCILTDWHYQILEQRGYTDLPYSYVTFLLERTIGWAPANNIVDAATVTALVLPLFLNLFFQFRGRL